MIVRKRSNFTGFEGFDTEQSKDKLEKFVRDLDGDLKTLVLALQGKLRFGNGATATSGENIGGEFIVFTSNGSADTEETVNHSIGSVPVGYLVLKQNKAASLYLGTTSWTSSAIYLKSNTASTTYTIFIIK